MGDVITEEGPLEESERLEEKETESPLAAGGVDAGYAPGTVVAGRFRVVSFLGRGGMGVVYEATQLSVNRSVALKILPSGISKIPDVVRRFRQEAEIIASLAHPNIVTLIDFGQTESGELFLAMELVRGKLLADELRQGVPLSPPTAVSILQQILLALEHAHLKGIVHRDLKPSNVMLMETGDGASFVKLLDFGIAKVLAQPSQSPGVTATGVGVVVGTPYYVAPEQAAGGKADARSDIYSAGLLLYELLNGTPPFFDDDAQEVLVRQLYEDLPALPTEITARVPSCVLAALARATRKRPGDRFQTAREMRFALVGEPMRDTRQPADAVPSVVSAKASRTQSAQIETPTAFETRVITGTVRPSVSRRGWAVRVIAVAVTVVVAAVVTIVATQRGETPGTAERVVNVEAPATASAPATAKSPAREPEPTPILIPSPLVPLPAPATASAPATQPASAPALVPAPAPDNRSRARDRARARARARSSSPAPSSAPATASAPAPASAPVTAPARAPAAPSELRVIAWCRDTDKPCWAAISLNGADQQTTRVARFKVKDGTHTVRVDKEGYETVFRRLKLAGAPVEITVPLVRTP